MQEQEEYREEEKVLEDCPYPYSPCSFDSDSDDDQHIQNEIIIDNSFESDEEFGLDILYDNALDDGPIWELGSNNSDLLSRKQIPKLHCEEC